MEKKERLPGIELLRIFCIVGIIIMHFLGGISNGFQFAEDNGFTMTWNSMWILELIFCPAVDIFIIISGYFLYGTSERSWWKPIKLLSEVVIINIFTFLLKIIIVTLFNDSFIKQLPNTNILGIVRLLLPVNYFAILYSVLYFISYYYNILCQNLNNKTYRHFVIYLFVLFSIFGFSIDILQNFFNEDIMFGLSPIGSAGSQAGYTIINFSLCYVIGTYIAAYRETFNKTSNVRLVLLLLINFILQFCWLHICKKLQLLNHYTNAYNNPLVIINAVILFVLFSRIKISNNNLTKIINVLAKSVFFTFLTHSYLLGEIKPNLIVSDNPLKTLAFIFIISFVIYIICFICFLVFNFFEQKVLRLLYKKFGNLYINY